MDCYLAGWRARQLSLAGRLALLNAGLDSIPIYPMAAMRLPHPRVFATLEKLRRVFLWNFAHRASGPQCLVACERVCRSKAEGVLGVQPLKVQNDSLLLKLLHRLHDEVLSRWASWVWGQMGSRSLLARSRSP
ncbi:retrotransposon unclassified [Hordeum vulgare]|nr:retrotransposon unclassified [Hordeum vulgare]